MLSHHLNRTLTLALCVSALALTSARAQNAADLVKVELLAEPAAIMPGEPFTVGIKLSMKEHWHTYWRNPGDSGEPTQVTWKLPQGFVGRRSRVAGAVADPGRAGREFRLRRRARSCSHASRRRAM